MRKKLKSTLSLALALAFLMAMAPSVTAISAVPDLMGPGIAVTVDEGMSMTVYRVEADGTNTPMTQKPSAVEAGQSMFSQWNGKLPWSVATGTNANTDFVAASSKLLSDKSGYVTTGTRASAETATDDFQVELSQLDTNVTTYFGTGNRLTVTGYSPSLKLTRVLVIESANDLPGTVSVTSKYRYDGEGTLDIAKFVENSYMINDTLDSRDYQSGKVEAGLWTMQGAALVWGADDIIPVFDTIGTRGATAIEAEKAAANDLTSRNNWFWAKNGGTPYNDFYGRRVGIGIGSAMPYQVYGMELPTRGSGVTGKHDTAYAWIGWPGKTLVSGEMTDVGTSVVTVHTGDYFEGAGRFSAAINRLSYNGASVALPTAESLPSWAYAPLWETWGYGEGFFPENVLDMVPELRALGIKSITLDAGWYQRDENFGEGVYLPDPAKWLQTAHRFNLPCTTQKEAVKVIRAFVDRLHDEGFFVTAWCMPSLGYVAGSYNTTSHAITNPAGVLWTEHKDWFASATAVDMSPAGVAAGNVPAPWRESGYYNNARRYDFCLANPSVLNGFTDYFAQLMFGDGADEYNFDGLKIDSIWGMHQCLATGHGHDGDPNAPVRAYSQFYKAIYDKGMALTGGNLVIKNCNCGTPMNYFDWNGTNRPTPGDFIGSRQMRYRIKMYKGFYGGTFPIDGDHLYLSTLNTRNEGVRRGSIDFLSFLGTGAVFDSKYITDKFNPLNEDDTDLDQRKKMRYPSDANAHNKDQYDVMEWDEYIKNFALYSSMGYAESEMLGGLYQYGLDYPEAYAFRKGNERLYSFYATSGLVGTVYNTAGSFKNNGPVVDPWGGAYDSANTFSGAVELRGLTGGIAYVVYNNVSGEALGVHTANPDGVITLPNVSFTTGLLLKAVPYIPVSGVTFNANAVISIRRGQTLDLGGLTGILPSNASFSDVFYTSTNPAVAQVDKNTGRVIALKTGMAIVQAHSVDGGKMASVLITVTM